MNDPENFTFYIGGKDGNLFLLRLAWHLDLYNISVATSPDFVVFFEHCHKRFPPEVNEFRY